jgi:hypothetical protein
MATFGELQRSATAEIDSKDMFSRLRHGMTKRELVNARWSAAVPSSPLASGSVLTIVALFCASRRACANRSSID